MLADERKTHFAYQTRNQMKNDGGSRLVREMQHGTEGNAVLRSSLTLSLQFLLFSQFTVTEKVHNTL